MRLFRVWVAAILLVVTLGAAPAAATDPVWTTGGPEGGAVDGLAISPNFVLDRTLFAATNGGGVFKTTDAGESWQQINNGLNGLGVYAVAISPDYTNDHMVVVGLKSTGIFRSTDGGASWVQAPAPMADKEVHFAAFSPDYANDRTLFAATGSGVFRSGDGGDTWTQTSSGLTNLTVYEVALSPGFATDGTLFAGTNGGVFRSTSRGASWTAVHTGMTALDVRALALSPAFVTDRTLFAGTESSGMFRSVNGGDSWTAINSGHTPQRDVWSIVVSPNFAVDNTLYTGCPSWQGFKSTNRGNTWTMYQFDIDRLDEGSRILPDVWAMALSPGFASDRTMFVGLFGSGVLRSTDAGASWTLARRGIWAARVMALAASPANQADPTVFVGMNGGGVFASLDAGASWHNRNARNFWLMDTYALAVSPNYGSDHTLFAGNPGGAASGGHGVSRTTDGGITWYYMEDWLENRNIRSLAISPAYASDETVYAGTACADSTCASPPTGVYRSTNRGYTWSRAMDGLPYKNVYALAISPGFASDHTLFAGLWGGGVYKSTDAGNSWTSAQTGLQNQNVWSLALSPSFVTDRTLFAGTERGLFRSTDGGANWSALTNTLSTRRITSIAVSHQFAQDRTLYVGSSNGGVFRSTDGGDTWSAFVSGLGHTYVQTLAITGGASPRLYAGTVGGGVWQIPLGSLDYWTLPLQPGWNLISIPREPSDTSLEVVLGSISGKYDIVCTYDGHDAADPWKRYQTAFPFYDLYNLDSTDGIWVRMTTAATLSVGGALPTTTQTPLARGWNLVGYPAGSQRPLAEALASISAMYDLVYAFDAGTEEWFRYSTTVPDWVNTLSVMTPGSGYWIRVTQDCTWTVVY